MYVAMLLMLSLASIQGYNINNKFSTQNIKSNIAKALIGGSLLTGSMYYLPVLTNSVPAAFAKSEVSIFDGNYNDPNHPGCLRKISSKAKEITIVGSDDINGNKQWVLKAQEQMPGTIFVDFSPKGGPPNLLGVFDEAKNGIVWPDKNVWTKIAIAK